MLARRRLMVAGAVLAILVPTREAIGDPVATVLHIATTAHVTTDGGSKLDLPPGYFFPEPKYAELNTEVKRLQDAEVRLTAENGSLQAAASAPGLGWKSVLVVLVVGLGGGIALAEWAH